LKSLPGIHTAGHPGVRVAHGNRAQVQSEQIGGDGWNGTARNRHNDDQGAGKDLLHRVPFNQSLVHQGVHVVFVGRDEDTYVRPARSLLYLSSQNRRVGEAVFHRHPGFSGEQLADFTHRIGEPGSGVNGQRSGFSHGTAPREKKAY